MKIKIIKSTYRNTSTKSEPIAKSVVTVRKEKSRAKAYRIARLINSEALVAAQFIQSYGIR